MMQNYQIGETEDPIVQSHMGGLSKSIVVLIIKVEQGIQNLAKVQRRIGQSK